MSEEKYSDITTVPSDSRCIVEDSLGNVYVGCQTGIKKFVRTGNVITRDDTFTSPFIRIDCMILVGETVYFVDGTGLIYRINNNSTSVIQGQSDLGVTSEFRLFSIGRFLYVSYFTDNFLKIRQRTHQDVEVFSTIVPIGTTYTIVNTPPVIRNKNIVYLESTNGVYIVTFKDEISSELKNKQVLSTTILDKRVYFVDYKAGPETFKLCGNDGTNVFFIQDKRRKRGTVIEDATTESICMIWKYPFGNTSTSATRSLINNFTNPKQFLITENYLYILGDSKLFHASVTHFGVQRSNEQINQTPIINEEPIYIIEQMPIPQMWQNIHMGKEGKNVSSKIIAPLMPYRTFGPIADIPGRQPNCVPRHLKPRASYGQPIMKYLPGGGLIQIGVSQDPESRIVATWPPSPV